MSKKIGIIDYSIGNIQSVINAFSSFDEIEISVVSDPKDLSSYDAFVFPGVGYFQEAMDQLRKKDFIPYLNTEIIEKKKPCFGICLGMQLFAEFSEETDGNGEGLGWIPGTVKKLTPTPPYKIPHMGWNYLSEIKESKLTETITDISNFYFVHSFFFDCPEEYILAKCDYSEVFPSIVQRDNIYATQFHPEKSATNGLSLIGNFVKLIKENH